MPRWYRRAHDLRAIHDHAAIVERRAGCVAHVELWHIRNRAVVVIVTDDRPAGLAMMSAAIAAAGFDIVMAETYRRERDPLPAEALAFFELRRPGESEAAITADEIGPIAAILESLVEGHASADGLLRRHGATMPPGVQSSPEVAFADDDEASILIVEARDRPGLLAAVTGALADASVQITDSEVITVDGRARDRFQLAEADGSPLSPSRRSDIVQRVRAAIE
jgi:[protein-PII] uridylyltransferase